MTSVLEILDMDELRLSLDAFLHEVLSRREDHVLEGAKPLLDRLLEARGRPIAEAPAASRGWVATRMTEPDGTRNITCWNEDGIPATLLGEWKGPALDSWSVEIGDRSHVSQLAAADRSADESEKQQARMHLGARAREQFLGWVSSHKRRRAYCPLCSFENEEHAQTCVMCGGTIGMPFAANANPGLEDENSARTVVINPKGGPLKPSPEIESRPEKVPLAPPAAIEAPRFEVVLRSFPLQRREDVLAFLRELLRQAGRHDSIAQELIGALPAVIESRVSIVRARELSDQLRALEASVEIRRTRS